VTACLSSKMTAVTKDRKFLKITFITTFWIGMS